MVDMVFLVFIGFLYPPPAWKVFLLGQKSSPKDFLSVVVVYAFFFSALGNFWTFFDIFRTFCRHSLFLGCPTICPLQFFSLVFWCPWCFSCCNFPWSFRLFSAYFQGILRVRKVRKTSLMFLRGSLAFSKTPRKRRTGFLGQEKINVNILGGTVSGTNRNRPWDKRDPFPGQTGTCPWDKPAFLCLIPQ